MTGLRGMNTVFEKENLALFFNEDSAILYSVLTGGMKKLTLIDGKKLENILNLYWNNKLTAYDKEKLEDYLNKMFESNNLKKKLPAKKMSTK